MTWRCWFEADTKKFKGGSQISLPIENTFPLDELIQDSSPSTSYYIYSLLIQISSFPHYFRNTSRHCGITRISYLPLSYAQLKSVLKKCQQKHVMYLKSSWKQHQPQVTFVSHLSMTLTHTLISGAQLPQDSTKFAAFNLAIAVPFRPPDSGAVVQPLTALGSTLTADRRLGRHGIEQSLGSTQQKMHS